MKEKKNINIRQYQPLKYEPANRFCPICGELIRTGDSIHRCSLSVLKKIELKNHKIEQQIEESEISEEVDDERTLNDRFEEEEDMFFMDND
jgi:hypothetical protein